MTTLKVNINNKKTERVIKALLEALGLEYEIDNHNPKTKSGHALNKKEREVYREIKGSLEEIQRWERGEAELKPAEDLLNEL